MTALGALLVSAGGAAAVTRTASATDPVGDGKGDAKTDILSVKASYNVDTGRLKATVTMAEVAAQDPTTDIVVWFSRRRGGDCPTPATPQAGGALLWSTPKGESFLGGGGKGSLGKLDVRVDGATTTAQGRARRLAHRSWNCIRVQAATSNDADATDEVPYASLTRRRG